MVTHIQNHTGFCAIEEIRLLRESWVHVNRHTNDEKHAWWIRLLQRALIEHGIDQALNLRIEVDGHFGPVTEKAVKLFQRKKQLQTDGRVGPQTWNALGEEPGQVHVSPIQSLTLEQFELLVTPALIRLRICTIAQALLALHTRERGNNRGEVVDALNRHATKNRGEIVGIPWCISTADFCVDGGYLGTGKTPPYDVGTSSSALHRNAQAHNRLRTWQTARAGDLFVLPGGDTGWQHGGVIVGVSGELLQTIEGNTNEAGSSEGQGVYLRKRNARTQQLAIASVTD